MEQSVTIKYRWTAEELLRAQHYDRRHTYPAVLRFVGNFNAGVVLFAGVVELIIGNGRYRSLAIALIALAIYWFTLRRWERRWMTRRRFSKRPDKDAEVEWQVAPERIFSRDGLAQSEFGWAALAKVVRTPAGVLLYSNDQIFHWLPRHGFASDADFERFIELSKTKIQRYYEVA